MASNARATGGGGPAGATPPPPPPGNLMNLYDTLGVASSATANDITTAYRKLALLYHPDRAEGSKEKFQEIQSAYEVLHTPASRANYDILLRNKPALKNFRRPVKMEGVEKPVYALLADLAFYEFEASPSKLRCSLHYGDGLEFNGERGCFIGLAGDGFLYWTVGGRGYATQLCKQGSDMALSNVRVTYRSNMGLARKPLERSRVGGGGANTTAGAAAASTSAASTPTSAVLPGQRSYGGGKGTSSSNSVHGGTAGAGNSRPSEAERLREHLRNKERHRTATKRLQRIEQEETDEREYLEEKLWDTFSNFHSNLEASIRCVQNGLPVGAEMALFMGYMDPEDVPVPPPAPQQGNSPCVSPQNPPQAEALWVDPLHGTPGYGSPANETSDEHVAAVQEGAIRGSSDKHREMERGEIRLPRSPSSSSSAASAAFSRSMSDDSDSADFVGERDEEDAAPAAATSGSAVPRYAPHNVAVHTSAEMPERLNQTCNTATYVSTPPSGSSPAAHAALRAVPSSSSSLCHPASLPNLTTEHLRTTSGTSSLGTYGSQHVLTNSLTAAATANGGGAAPAWDTPEGPATSATRRALPCATSASVAAPALTSPVTPPMAQAITVQYASRSPRPANASASKSPSRSTFVLRPLHSERESMVDVSKENSQGLSGGRGADLEENVLPAPPLLTSPVAPVSLSKRDDASCRDANGTGGSFSHKADSFLATANTSSEINPAASRRSGIRDASTASSQQQQHAQLHPQRPLYPWSSPEINSSVCVEDSQQRRSTRADGVPIQPLGAGDYDDGDGEHNQTVRYTAGGLFSKNLHESNESTRATTGDAATAGGEPFAERDSSPSPAVTSVRLTTIASSVSTAAPAERYSTVSRTRDDSPGVVYKNPSLSVDCRAASRNFWFPSSQGDVDKDVGTAEEKDMSTSPRPVAPSVPMEPGDTSETVLARAAIAESADGGLSAVRSYSPAASGEEQRPPHHRHQHHDVVAVSDITGASFSAEVRPTGGAGDHSTEKHQGVRTGDREDEDEVPAVHQEEAKVSEGHVGTSKIQPAPHATPSMNASGSGVSQPCVEGGHPTTTDPTLSTEEPTSSSAPAASSDPPHVIVAPLHLSTSLEPAQQQTSPQEEVTTVLLTPNANLAALKKKNRSKGRVTPRYMLSTEAHTRRASMHLIESPHIGGQNASPRTDTNHTYSSMTAEEMLAEEEEFMNSFAKTKRIS